MPGGRGGAAHLCVLVKLFPPFFRKEVVCCNIGPLDVCVQDFIWRSSDFFSFFFEPYQIDSSVSNDSSKPRNNGALVAQTITRAYVLPRGSIDNATHFHFDHHQVWLPKEANMSDNVWCLLQQTAHQQTHIGGWLIDTLDYRVLPSFQTSPTSLSVKLISASVLKNTQKTPYWIYSSSRNSDESLKRLNDVRERERHDRTTLRLGNPIHIWLILCLDSGNKSTLVYVFANIYIYFFFWSIIYIAYLLGVGMGAGAQPSRRWVEFGPDLASSSTEWTPAHRQGSCRELQLILL